MIEFAPRPYQQAGIDLMLACGPLLKAPGCFEGAGLLLEPGSGKTVTALTAADILMNERWAVEKTLVVAPKMVAQEVWTREVVKWKHTAHLQVEYLDASWFEYYRKVTTSAIWGDEERVIVENGMTDEEADFLFCADVKVSRTELVPGDWRRTKDTILRSRAQIHVISRDHLFVLTKLLGRDWPYGLVLGDESTMWKNADSKRSQAIRWARKKGVVQMLTLMSGTPSPRGLENLFSQVLLLDNGRRLGEHITKFRERFMEPAQKRYNPVTRREVIQSWRAKPGATQRVTELIADICLSVRADEWRKTEPPRTVPRYVQLPEKARSIYATLQDELHVELDNGADVTVGQAAVLCNKLVQVASGVLFDNEREVHALHDEKLQALDELIEELEGEPLIIAYWFKPTLDRLKKRYGRRLATTKTKGFLDLFARGELPLLAIQPSSAGHGLDGLQHGGHHLAVVDMFPNWEEYQQVVSRLDRTGQLHQVTVHQILAEDTRDLHVAGILADRGADQGLVMDALTWRRAR